MKKHEFQIPTPEQCGFESESPLFNATWPKTVSISKPQSDIKSVKALETLSRLFPQLKDATAIIRNAVEEGGFEPRQNQSMPEELENAVAHINKALASQN